MGKWHSRVVICRSGKVIAIKAWCREMFGKPYYKLDCHDGVWDCRWFGLIDSDTIEADPRYEFRFKNTEDLVMFALRWL